MPYTVSREQEAAIISACKKHESQHEPLEKGYRRCVLFEDFFVKFDDYNSMYPQYMTQKYISEFAATNPDAPHVPEIYHFFISDSPSRMSYLVMERIEFTPTAVDELSKRAAQALQWLHDLPIPADAAIGGLGGGRARHVLFENNEAPLDFSSIEALERYLNTAILQIRPIKGPRPTPIDISHESLVFTQSDMDISNFGVDKNGKTCLFDFGFVGLLPQSFVTYTMSPGWDNFASKVASHMVLPPSHNISSMGKVRSFLWMYFDPKLGLDNDGMPRGKL